MTDKTTNDQSISRRQLLARLGLLGAGAAACAASAGGVGIATGFFDRIAGVTHTELLTASAWTYAASTITVDLTQSTLLATTGTAARIEGDDLPNHVLLIHSLDGEYAAYKNECTHGGNRIDLKEGGELQCTSFSSSTFDSDGTVLSGPAPAPLVMYRVEQEGDQLLIRLA